MKRQFGFTLVELLVVIAIISILAAIVTPRVQVYLLKGRMTKAVSEIEGINTALTKVLTDANKDNLRHLFKEPDPANPAGMFAPPADEAELKTQVDTYTIAFYEILRQGRNASLPAGLTFADGVQGKLSTSYVDLGRDPWDSTYKFWVGPWNGYEGSPNAYVPFRSFRTGEESEDGTVYTPYVYNSDSKDLLDAQLPGNPPFEDPALPGFPAPKDLGIYIFSPGVNMRVDQYYNDSTVGGTLREDNYRGGGDDINNWDNELGWTGFYS